MTAQLPDNFDICRCVNPVLYGGNMLFHRNNIGPDGNFDELVGELGLTSLRYPGGAISEAMFDIRNPDATSAIDPNTSDAVPIEPLSEVAAFAAANDIALTIVVPTRTYLGTATDAFGHRLPDVDAEGLRDFVTKLVGGQFGAARIEALEIGNEYWGIGDFAQGSMTTLEYARVATEMTRIMDDTLATVPGGDDVAILVQMGTNYGYADLSADYADVPRGAELDSVVRSEYDLPADVNFLTASGDMNWTRVANHIIIEQFADAGVLDQVDGVVTHIYSRYPDSESSRHWSLDIIESTWGEEVPGIETWVTEWSRKAKTDVFDDTDYGLKSAHELVDMIGVFGAHEVDGAYYWTPQHNTLTALAGMTETPEGTPPPLTAAGEIFRMMANNIEGANVVDLAPADPHTNAILQGGIDIHAYIKPGQMVMYLANANDSAENIELDVSNYLDDYDSVQLTRLGVRDGQNPGDPQSEPVVTDIDPATSVDGMVLTQTFKPFEILQVVVNGANFSPDMTAELIAARVAAGRPLDGMIMDADDDMPPPEDNPDDAPDDIVVPPADDPDIILEPPPAETPADTPETESATDAASSGGVGMDFLFLLGLPLLLGLAFAL